MWMSRCCVMEFFEVRHNLELSLYHKYAATCYVRPPQRILHQAAYTSIRPFIVPSDAFSLGFLMRIDECCRGVSPPAFR